MTDDKKTPDEPTDERKRFAPELREKLVNISADLADLVIAGELAGFQLIALGPIEYPEEPKSADDGPGAAVHLAGGVIQNDTGAHAGCLINELTAEAVKVMRAQAEAAARDHGIKQPAQPPPSPTTPLTREQLNKLN